MKKQRISLLTQRKSKGAIIRTGIIVSIMAVIVLLSQFSSHLAPVEAQSSSTSTPSFVAPCTTPPTGMALWLPGDGNAHDISGNNNNGSEGTQTAFAAGEVAQAFQFNGNGNSQIIVPDSNSLHITTAITIDAWVNPAAGNNGLPSIVFKGNVGTLADQPYSLFFIPGTSQINFRLGNNSTATAISSTTQLPLNSYTHVAATYDGTTMSIYINGVLDASQTTNIGTLNNTDTNPVIIGSYIDNFIGTVDELEIFNRALAQSEVQAIASAGSAGKCKPATPPPATACTPPPSGMVAWYPAEGNGNDIKGGNNGTLGGQTAFAAGKVAQAFQFNGNGNTSVVTVPDSPSLHITSALTIDAWVNPSNGDAIVLKGNFGTASGQPYGILVGATTATSEQIVFSIGNNSTFDRVASGSFIPLNAYTHIAGTYDGTTMRIYINGVLDMSKTTSIGTLNTIDTNPLRIGAGSSVPYNGAVDELEIFNRAISDTEVFNIYNAGSFGKCRTGSTFPALPTYNAVNDFSIISNPSPLNGGVWSYGSAASLGAAFTLYANNQTSAGGGTLGNALIDAWDAAGNTPPGVFHNTSNSTQTYSTTVNQPATMLNLQPGSYSFVRWTAPTTGEYQLQGQFQGIDSTPTTTDVYVIRNYGTPSQLILLSGSITSNGGTLPFTNVFFGIGNIGDTIDLIVGPGTGGSTNDSTGLTATVTKLSNTPTAADSTISGHIATTGGAPVSGATVILSGTQSRRSITDSNGNYRFDNVETTGFYTVTPSRANYSFSPANRSFSIIGNQTNAGFTAEQAAETANPLDNDLYFVRQHYLDFLSREPDTDGLAYWSSRIDSCDGEADCVHQARIGVSAAFFIENEFQQTGSFIYRFYEGALGRQVNYQEFSADRQQVIMGINLDAAKTAFAAAFVQRQEFLQRYSNATTAESFVDALVQTVQQTSGADLSSQRNTLINRYNSGSSLNESRSLVIREAIEIDSFKVAEYNKSFVLMQYFGYLRRDPDETGYDFWLNVLNNRVPGNYRSMVCAFLTSAEYQRRFSTVVTHSNYECGQ